jgi:hypothetical protein
MARASESRPKWAEEFLANYKPPTRVELKRRKEAFERAWENRVNIAPLTTTELIRSIREGEDDSE